MADTQSRLRQERHDRPQSLAPADAPPHRRAAVRRVRARSRWLAPSAAAAAVLAGAGLVGCGRPGAADRQVAGADPPLVAVAGRPGPGAASQIELISPTTGRVAKVVARTGTGNGFALSPDSTSLYVVGPVGGTIEIRRISVATGKASFVADGAYPAVSPDGRYLAYAAGPRFAAVAVRDLRTGHTRVLDLRPQLGNGNLLNQGGISWLGDGSELVVLPGVTASAAAAVTAGAAGAAAAAGGAAAPPGRQPLIVVKVSPDGLAARRIVVSDPYQNPFAMISGDLSRRRAVLVATMGFGAPGTITRVSLRGAGTAARVIARLPSETMPVVIAPRGDRILYLAGHAPPVLWTASIIHGRLTGQRRLSADAGRFAVDQAAW